MEPRMEYLRDSGMALAKELLDAAGTGMLAPRIEGIMCQAAAYIVQNEGVLEQVQETLYLIEERLAISLEHDITPEEMEKAMEGLGEQAQGDPDT